jgi:signal transduction histidine kinase
MRDAAPTLPIVIMTGLNDEAMAIEAMRKGAQDYLVKGQVDTDTLIRAVRYAIERKRIEAQIQHLRDREAVLREINVALTSTLDLKSILNALLEKIIILRPKNAAFIRLQNYETGVMEPVACRNLDEADWKSTAVTFGQSLSHAVKSAGGPVAILDVRNDPRSSHSDFYRRNGLVSFLGLPLIVDAQFLGVLAVYTRELHEFGRGEIEFFSTLASQASIAIRNSHLYEKLKTSNETLEKTLKIKSVLTGVMAHELKTPIQVIMGAAGMLSAGMCGDLSDEQRKRVETIESSADELLQLIDSSLQMVRLEQGKIHLMVTEICPRTLLAELASEFETKFHKKGIELNIDAPLSGFMLKSDRIKLKEILRNLIDNARKFTPKGHVTVGFASKENDRVEIVVSDTGIGIDKEILPKVFELLYQVDPRHEEHAGAGLGLNIVKRLVNALSGEIEVTSEVGRGTTFRITLPSVISDLDPISSLSF